MLALVHGFVFVVVFCYGTAIAFVDGWLRSPPRVAIHYCRPSSTDAVCVRANAERDEAVAAASARIATPLPPPFSEPP